MTREVIIRLAYFNDDGTESDVFVHLEKNDSFLGFDKAGNAYGKITYDNKDRDGVFWVDKHNGCYFEVAPTYKLSKEPIITGA